MTKRAKKLGTYLQDVLGWSVFSFTHECSACKYVSEFGTPNFCQKCGAPMVKRAKKDAVNELEEALKHALGE